MPCVVIVDSSATTGAFAQGAGDARFDLDRVGHYPPINATTGALTSCMNGVFAATHAELP